jgi:serine/threonine protein kinase
MATPKPNDWREVSSYLDQALALDEDERAAWVKLLGESNPDIAGALQELLDEHKALAKEHFLEEPVPSLNPSLAQPGQNIGAYTLLSVIGQGGMGSVWLAQRNDGRFERQAAVKFLNAGPAGYGGEARFKREGKILGQLRHPHIAELLDAGMTSGGHPFLVLEYVNGEHIDRYCDRHMLDVEARISLFLDVLAAVAHAHANLIVHRDIKPSNVLVASDGKVKLLDFGIAKLLGTEGRTGAPTMTREGGSALTPEYAAPEQVTDGPITTGTDVHGLGLLLYLLLTGQHPAGPGPHSAANLVKAIVENEPPRPSEAVVGGEAKEERAAARSSTPERMRRILSGDLDTIVLKALKKDPAERYVSIAAFADDLRRYLRHEPISARPDTVTYRAAKFARRHRAAIAVGILVVASLSTGLYESNKERTLAERRFSELRQLSKRIFDLEKSIRDLPGSTEARQEVVSAILPYLDGLAADAGGNVELKEEIAEGYWRVARIEGVPTEINLGEPEKAEASLKKAERLIEEALASRPTYRQALLRSATIAQDRMILAQTEHRDEDALAFGRQSAERLEALLRLGDPEDSERLEITADFGNIGLANLNMHRYKEVALYARRSTEVARPVPALRFREAQNLSLISSALRYQGDLDGALQSIQEARTIAEHATYPNETSHVLDQYGIMLREGLLLGEEGGVNLGRAEEAIEPLQKAFDLNKSLARKDSKDATSRTRMATSGDYLGSILRRKDPGRALAVYDLALRELAEIRESKPSMRLRARLLADSSYALRDLHRTAEAKHRITMALETLQRTKDYPAAQIGPDSDAYKVLCAYGDYEAEEDDAHRAVEVYEKLLAAVSATNPRPQDDLRDAPKLSRLYGALARLYQRTGKAGPAKTMEAKRLELWQGWDKKLPGNSFVRRELRAATTR